MSQLFSDIDKFLFWLNKRVVSRAQTRKKITRNKKKSVLQPYSVELSTPINQFNVWWENNRKGLQFDPTKQKWVKPRVRDGHIASINIP